MHRLILCFLLAVTTCFTSVQAQEAKTTVKVTFIEHAKNKNINSFAKTVATLVELYYPELIHLLNGKDLDKEKEIKILFLNDIKKPLTSPAIAKSDGLYLSSAHFKKVADRIATSGNNAGAIWLELFPEEAGQILIATAAMILKPNPKAPKWAVTAINDYIRFRFSFRQKDSKPAPGGSYKQSSEKAADFLRYIEQKYDRQLIAKLSRQLRKGTGPKSFFISLLGKNQDKLWQEYQHWLKKKDKLKQLWYPVSLKYSTCPDLERFAIKSKIICENYYGKLIEQLDSRGYKPYPNVRLEVKEMKGVAATGGNYIAYAADFYRKNKQDFGSVVHELTHVVQQSPAYDPVWVIESTADYLRYYYGYRGKLQESPGAHFTNGYQRGADFFKYIVNTYKLPNFIKDLNAEVRAKTFHVPFDKRDHKAREAARKLQLQKLDKFFIKVTSNRDKAKVKRGKTVQQLWDEYQQWLTQSDRPALWENQGMFAVSIDKAVKNRK